MTISADLDGWSHRVGAFGATSVPTMPRPSPQPKPAPLPSPVERPPGIRPDENTTPRPKA